MFLYLLSKRQVFIFISFLLFLKMFYLYYFRVVLKLFPFFVLKIYIFDIFSRTINLLNFRKHFVRYTKIGKCFIIFIIIIIIYFFKIKETRDEPQDIIITIK